MKEIEDIVKRYYQGESTLAEERFLKEKFAQGELKDEAILAFQGQEQMPEEVITRIQTRIRQKKTQRHAPYAYWGIGIAATVILIIFLRGFLSQPAPLPLSDNLKKERFEDALRIIGQVLEEPIPKKQEILYEDNKFIISIE